MMVYSETVDFSKYEDGIRNLLNTFVTSEPVEIVVDPVAIHDKEAMDSNNCTKKMIGGYANESPDVLY